MSEHQQWGAYARLQERLARKRQLDDHAWGLEAGLNCLLDHSQHPRSEEDAARAVRSESRKERHQAKLRRLHLSPGPITRDLLGAVYAGLYLRTVQAFVTKRDWVFLRAIGEGHGYDELAAHYNVSPGSLRIRALRLRRYICLHIPRSVARAASPPGASGGSLPCRGVR